MTPKSSDESRRLPHSVSAHEPFLLFNFDPNNSILLADIYFWLLLRARLDILGFSISSSIATRLDRHGCYHEKKHKAAMLAEPVAGGAEGDGRSSPEDS